MTITIIVTGCIIAIYFYFKNKAKTHLVNIKRVGLAAAHTYIVTGSLDARMAALAVKSTLGEVDGDHLVDLIGRLPDIAEQAQLNRQSDIRQLLDSRSLNLNDQIDCKLELRKSGSRWSAAVETANFDIASDILLLALN